MYSCRSTLSRITTIMMTVNVMAKMMMLMTCIKTFPPTHPRNVPDMLKVARCIIMRQSSGASGYFSPTVRPDFPHCNNNNNGEVFRTGSFLCV